MMSALEKDRNGSVVRPYRAGRSKHWIKVKNRQHPAMSQVMEAISKVVVASSPIHLSTIGAWCPI
jgi:hypothetical protein